MEKIKTTAKKLGMITAENAIKQDELIICGKNQFQILTDTDGRYLVIIRGKQGQQMGFHVEESEESVVFMMEQLEK